MPNTRQSIDGIDGLPEQGAISLHHHLAVSLALAQAAAASGSEGPPAFEPAIVELRVNEQDDGPTLVVRRDPGGALLLRAEDLPQLRIRTPSRGLMLVDGAGFALDINEFGTSR